MFQSTTGPLSTKDKDLDLWNAFRQGDRHAFDTIYQQYIRPLFNYGSKFTQDPTFLEDCIQDIFVDLWEKRKNLGPTDCIKFYLFAVLRRNILHKLSSAKHAYQDSKLIHLMLAEESPEFKLMVDQSVAHKKTLLQQAINQLSDRQKEVIFLRFYEELSFESISKVMDIDIKSVYKLTYKAFAALKKNISAKDLFIYSSFVLMLLFLP